MAVTHKECKQRTVARLFIIYKKMKAKIMHLVTLVTIALFCLTISACSDDDGGSSGIRGFYASKSFLDLVAEVMKEYPDEKDLGIAARCHYFRDSKTEEIFLISASSSHKSSIVFSKVINGKTMYFYRRSTDGVFAYYIKNNIIYSSSGSIMPISGGSIYEDGTEYVKIN